MITHDCAGECTDEFTYDCTCECTYECTCECTYEGTYKCTYECTDAKGIRVPFGWGEVQFGFLRWEFTKVPF